MENRKVLDSLQRRLIGLTKPALRRHIQRIAGMSCDTLFYGDDQSIEVACADALQVARDIYRFMDLLDTQVAGDLLDAAGMDTTAFQGDRNLAAWLGSRTRAWHAVMNYSDLDPYRRVPWFSEMDEDSQRNALLLVAAALLSE